MPTSPFGADASIGRLVDEGYCLTVIGGHLVVEHVPYIAPGGAVKLGRLALPVVVAGDVVRDDTNDHRIWFVGEQPHDTAGVALPGPTAEAHAITEGLVADYMISSKPRGVGSFPNIHDKIASYVRVLAHPAQALDPSASARLGGGLTEVPDDLPFHYLDTGTARAGLARINTVFRGHRIGIIGLGGTGSYILDQVAKTWVDAIDLFDGDTFDNHNAFRAPGAADLAELRERPNKAEHFAAHYSRMRTGITAHPVNLTAGNLHLVADCTFVFLAAADAAEKPAIVEFLAAREIPSTEVGMGIQDENGRLSGLMAVTNRFRDSGAKATSSPHAAGEYDRNIQVADLNGLNAMLAVIAWKKYLGYYADAEQAAETIYKLFTGTIRNEHAARPAVERDAT